MNVVPSWRKGPSDGAIPQYKSQSFLWTSMGAFWGRSKGSAGGFFHLWIQSQAIFCHWESYSLCSFFSQNPVPSLQESQGQRKGALFVLITDGEEAHRGTWHGATLMNRPQITLSSLADL